MRKKIVDTHWNPHATSDFREWLQLLEEHDELKRVTVEVDWNLELSAITRVNLAQKGPGLLFENIKDYRDSFCNKMVTCSASNGRQIRLMLGMAEESGDKEVVKELRQRFENPVKPVILETGPVKENIVKGKAIDLEKLPIPIWSRLDGGRYIDTFGAVVTKDPQVGQFNIGIYRGMLLGKDRIGKLIVPSQHWGSHFAKHKDSMAPMPVAIVFGAHDIVPLCAATPFAKDICEYDMMGAVLGQPMPLVKCETNDLLIPANAEIVIEGFISPNPDSFEMEGPFAEYPGYAGGKPSPKPVLKVSCISHRNNPIFRGAQEGARPGFPSEDSAICAYLWSAAAWQVVERQGIGGITDFWLPPVVTGTTAVVQINKRYHGHAQQVAAALWGNSSSTFFYKNVTVVEEDIDIRDREALEWAMTFRMDAGDGQLVTYGPTPGSPLDPSVAQEYQNPKKYGAACWTRVLFDATRSWKFDPNPMWQGERFAPVAVMPSDVEQQVCAKWSEYGISEHYLDERQRNMLTYSEFSKKHPEWIPYKDDSN
ncbi:MAG: UbiD family decarboxylase [Pseudomonadales bacterium]|nr:UbiD family decarboxylase [Pseudomonadales bacterium]MCP5215306.1 UbiD family decarboxylase [Pseudomonadales bacterium]